MQYPLLNIIHENIYFFQITLKSKPYICIYFKPTNIQTILQNLFTNYSLVDQCLITHDSCSIYFREGFDLRSFTLKKKKKNIKKKEKCFEKVTVKRLERQQKIVIDFLKQV